MAAPLLKQGAKTVGRHLLDTGLKVMGDIQAGKPIKTAITQRVRQKLSGQKQRGATKRTTTRPKVSRRRTRTKQTSPLGTDIFTS